MKTTLLLILLALTEEAHGCNVLRGAVGRPDGKETQSTQYSPQADDPVFVVTSELLEREHTSFINLRSVKSQLIVVDLARPQRELGIIGGVATTLQIRRGEIERFALMRTPIDKISVTGNGVSCKVFSVVGAKISDLDWAPRIAKLDVLSVQRCAVKILDFDQLAGMKLSTLDLTDSGLERIAGGAKMTEIQALDLRFNARLRNWEVVLELPGIKEVHVDSIPANLRRKLADLEHGRGVKVISRETADQAEQTEPKTAGP